MRHFAVKTRMTISCTSTGISCLQTSRLLVALQSFLTVSSGMLAQHRLAGTIWQVTQLTGLQLSSLCRREWSKVRLTGSASVPRTSTIGDPLLSFSKLPQRECQSKWRNHKLRSIKTTAKMSLSPG